MADTTIDQYLKDAGDWAIQKGIDPSLVEKYKTFIGEKKPGEKIVDIATYVTTHAKELEKGAVDGFNNIYAKIKNNIPPQVTDFANSTIAEGGKLINDLQPRVKSGLNGLSAWAGDNKAGLITAGVGLLGLILFAGEGIMAALMGLLLVAAAAFGMSNWLDPNGAAKQAMGGKERALGQGAGQAVIVEAPANGQVKLVENGKALKYVKNTDGNIEAKPVDKPEPVYIQPDPSKNDLLVVQVSEKEHGDIKILGIAQKQPNGTVGSIAMFPNGMEKVLPKIAGSGLDSENNGINTETVKKQLEYAKKVILDPANKRADSNKDSSLLKPVSEIRPGQIPSDLDGTIILIGDKQGKFAVLDMEKIGKTGMSQLPKLMQDLQTEIEKPGKIIIKGQFAGNAFKGKMAFQNSQGGAFLADITFPVKDGKLNLNAPEISAEVEKAKKTAKPAEYKPVKPSEYKLAKAAEEFHSGKYNDEVGGTPSALAAYKNKEADGLGQSV